MNNARRGKYDKWTHTTARVVAVLMGSDDSCYRDVADDNEGDYIDVDDK